MKLGIDITSFVVIYFRKEKIYRNICFNIFLSLLLTSS